MHPFLRVLQARQVGGPRVDLAAGRLHWSAEGEEVATATFVPVLWWSPHDDRAEWAMERDELVGQGPMVAAPLEAPCELSPLDEAGAHELVSRAASQAGLEVVVAFQWREGVLFAGLAEMRLQATPGAGPQGLLAELVRWLVDERSEAGRPPLQQRLVDIAAAPDAEASLGQLYQRAATHGLDVDRVTAAITGVMLGAPRQGLVFEAVAAALPWHPDTVVARLNLGVGLRDHARDLPAATRVQRQVTALAPDDARGWIELAQTLQRARDEAGLHMACAGAMAADPMHPGPWSLRGFSHRRQGDLHNAVADMTQAVSLGEADPALLHALGSGLQTLGRGDEAEPVLALAVATYPDADAFWRGGARARLGDIDGALADLATAIKAEPALAELAADEEDYLLIAEDPRFAALCAVDGVPTAES